LAKAKKNKGASAAPDEQLPAVDRKRYRGHSHLAQLTKDRKLKNMIKIVISNQRGGAAKTTTTLNLARYYADQGKRVLIIDTDPQGSITVVLGLSDPGKPLYKNPGKSLFNFLIHGHSLEDCIVSVHPLIDLLPSNRQTVEAEQMLLAQIARELTFVNVLPKVDAAYDVVLFDVAPSISLLQTCAVLYTQQILVPVSMDPLSIAGLVASVETARMLSQYFSRPIKTVAILPVIIDKRLGVTKRVMDDLETISAETGVPLLPGIPTDSTVTKASGESFLADFDPTCRAMLAYVEAFDALGKLLNIEVPVPVSLS
jgi:chromosome partitioning protein